MPDTPTPEARCGGSPGRPRAIGGNITDPIMCPGCYDCSPRIRGQIDKVRLTPAEQATEPEEAPLDAAEAASPNSEGVPFDFAKRDWPVGSAGEGSGADPVQPDRRRLRMNRPTRLTEIDHQTSARRMASAVADAAIRHFWPMDAQVRVRPHEEAVVALEVVDGYGDRYGRYEWRREDVFGAANVGMRSTLAERGCKRIIQEAVIREARQEAAAADAVDASLEGAE